MYVRGRTKMSISEIFIVVSVSSERPSLKEAITRMVIFEPSLLAVNVSVECPRPDAYNFPLRSHCRFARATSKLNDRASTLKVDPARGASGVTASEKSPEEPKPIAKALEAVKNINASIKFL